MKTKTFLLLCLFKGIAVKQLSAQNSQNGTGLVSEHFPGGNPFGVPVYYNGVQVDIIINFELDFHFISHFLKRTQVFNLGQVFGEAIVQYQEKILMYS
jgi:hypothetical protein